MKINTGIYVNEETLREFEKVANEYRQTRNARLELLMEQDVARHKQTRDEAPRELAVA